MGGQWYSNVFSAKFVKEENFTQQLLGLVNVYFHKLQ